MDSNTSSPTTSPDADTDAGSGSGSGRVPAGLEGLAGVVAELAARDPAGLPDPLACEQVLGLRQLLDQLEGCWLRLLAHIDGAGAAG